MRDIGHLDSEERCRVFASFFDEVIFPQRRKLIAYRDLTNQTAQLDSDGYLAQLIASIVIGVPGTARRGKSGSHPGDLMDGTEVKGVYRTEQKGGMEDTHLNFGGMDRDRMEEFFDRERAVIVHTSYDTAGRFKAEVLEINLRSDQAIMAAESFYDRSDADRPQLQSRLYPDGVRDRLHDADTSLAELGAVLLARVVETPDGAVVDKWAPEAGLALDEVLDLYAPVDLTHHSFEPRDDSPQAFFEDAWIAYRRSYIPYCELLNANQNIGFGNLSQHLVSLVTGIPGTDSNARGPDLSDGGEIKAAVGLSGDSLGTEDYPRLNMGKNTDKLMNLPSLYAVRVICPNDLLRVKVLEAPIEAFRKQVADYFSTESKYHKSRNMQYHVPRDFEDHVFTGKSGFGGPRELEFDLLLHLEEQPEGRSRCF